MFSYDALPESIRTRIADKAAEFMDDRIFRTYGLHEDPYHVLNWCVTSYLAPDRISKVYLGPIYIGVIRDKNREESLRHVLTRLYYITDIVTKADELRRLVMLAKIHSVSVIVDEAVETPFIVSIRTGPRHDFNDTKIVVKVKRYDVASLRDVVAGNYRRELVHGALYALLGYPGNEKYGFTRWLRSLGTRTGPEAVYAIKGWQRFFMTATVNGTEYLFGIPHSSVPVNDKLFTRRALNLNDGQLVREGTMEDISIFTQMLNLYLGEAAVPWALSNSRTAQENVCSGEVTTAEFDGKCFRMVLPGDVQSAWIVRHANMPRSLELPYTFPQLGTILYLMVLYGCGLLDTSTGLGQQWAEMKLNIQPKELLGESGVFVDNKGTCLVQASIDGTTYLGMDRYKSAAWYILDIPARRFVPIEDRQHDRIVSALEEYAAHQLA